MIKQYSFLQESKEFRKARFGKDTEQAEKIIKKAASERQRVNNALKNYSPSVTDKAVKDLDWNKTPLAKSANRSEHAGKLNRKISNKTMPKLRSLVKKDGIKKFNQTKAVKNFQKYGQKLLRRIY